mmetsp:Transcript_223/g.421  ORF Transcript_223/g.421 Transcript_223/m.421 type:complete len:299 (-) Transcript_223:96-992(-)
MLKVATLSLGALIIGLYEEIHAVSAFQIITPVNLRPFSPATEDRKSPSIPSSSDHAPDPFEVWAKMRTGLGTGPGSSPHTYWVGGGALYEAYSGKKIAIFEGFDVGKGVQLGENHVRQLSRKIFWFRDPDTGDVMTEYEGEPVRPIVYDCQMIDYHKNPENGSITYSVEASLRDVKGMPKLEITSQMIGSSQMMIQVPVFLDIPLANGQGRYQAWEFYDYNVDPSFPEDRPATASWCRQGSVPPFNTDSKAVLRFSGQRVDTFDELPERMRVLVDEKYPHFRFPPKDYKEVQDLSSEN